MRLILSIRILSGMRIQEFDIDVKPETLDIAMHPSRSGFEIKVLDTKGEPRMWFASDIYGIHFVKGT